MSERMETRPVSPEEGPGSGRVLAHFVLYSLAMFTLPFLAFVGTRYGLRNQFEIVGFANTVWSVLAAVVVTNVIIVSYACKGYHEDVESGEVDSGESVPDEKKEQ